MERHIIIEAVTPAVDCGRYPAKRIVGEPCVVEADIFRDGHSLIRAALRWRRASGGSSNLAPMSFLGNDRWRGEFLMDEPGRYAFTIEAWTDVYASWLADFEKWVEAAQPEVASEFEIGVSLIVKARRGAWGEEARVLDEFLTSLRTQGYVPEVLASFEQIAPLIARLEDREDLMIYDRELEVVADPPVARFGAWYEMFVRSNGTFRSAEERLAEIRRMGFDVVYLAPIHPIGLTNRKGPNGALTAGPDDPGSPWAIGTRTAGGHTAVEPSLGTLEDFDHFVATARELGLEIALDFAVQFSPDHPWVRDHPYWFLKRPDGSIRYAENPPMRYQDIHFLNFDTEDREDLWLALLEVVRFWIRRGIRIFRVDNPHTKPLVFWQWLIERVKSDTPDVLFLAEAFTRPKMMKVLSKAGFSQSYTYFLWRNTAAEFREYMTELTESGMEEYFRPNFFTTTPDVLPEVLQTGGRPAFKMRLVLAATLSPAYGIYSGYELCENAAIPGTEEYSHSEKFEIKVRDWTQPGNLTDFITRVNRIRQENPALHELTNLTFFETDNDQILCYGKRTGDNAIIVAVNMDPFHPHHANVRIPPDRIGVPARSSYQVSDLLTGARYTWGERNWVRLDPQVEPAHILRVERS